MLYPRIGPDALWYSQLISSVASVQLTLLVYRFGSWRRIMTARIAAQ